ncbi:MAG: 50S ribosomal protein L25 [Candidatus Omnitrophica bacterium]|nr:50S ribosomal protein L25 [Candidatus Omnitrophota bacterium]
MQIVQLSAQSRTETGKGVARKLRQNGEIPAILYGLDAGPLPLTVVRRDLALLLQGHQGQHLLLNLEVSGEKAETSLAVLHQLELDPVRNNVIHADFIRVDKSKPIHTTVPVTLVGTPIGVRNGGMEQHVLREVEVEALPHNVPEEITIDTSHLEIGDSLHVSDLSAEGKPYTILTEPERAIATVLAPKLATDDEETSADADGEVSEDSEEEETAEES